MAPRKKKILLWGASRSGKTSQFLTLPGKKFLFIFDPAGAEAIRGYDIDFIEFMPDHLNLNISATATAVQSKATKIQQGEPRAAEDFLRFLRESSRNGFFAKYDTIGLDSITFYAKLVMDRIVWQNSRSSHVPQQDDYAPEMNVVFNALREFTSLDKMLFASTHEELREDKRTGIWNTEYALTGKLRVWLTGLFSDVFRTTVGEGKDETGKYYLYTKKLKRSAGIGTSMKWLDPKVDVTITDWANPEAQGLGKLIREDEKRMGSLIPIQSTPSS